VEKIDLRKELAHLYKASARAPSVVDVPPMNFLMVDGAGDPNASPALERLVEGRSAQVLHVGPYSEEGPTVERLHAFIRQQGGEPSGKHHEIYLNDPRRTAPEKLKTILRQPMRESGEKR